MNLESLCRGLEFICAIYPYNHWGPQIQLQSWLASEYFLFGALVPGRFDGSSLLILLFFLWGCKIIFKVESRDIEIHINCIKE